MIDEFNGNIPAVDNASFVSENAVLIGAVKLGKDSSVWPAAVLRADVAEIIIGSRSNIQDGCIIHTSFGMPVILGDDVTVGHGAILHGCRVASGCLIGMGAVILDGAEIPESCIIGASALVPEGSRLESGGVYMGVPAKRFRDVTDAELELIKKRAQEYVEFSADYAGRRP